MGVWVASSSSKRWTRFVARTVLTWHDLPGYSGFRIPAATSHLPVNLTMNAMIFTVLWRYVA